MWYDVVFFFGFMGFIFSGEDMIICKNLKYKVENGKCFKF